MKYLLFCLMLIAFGCKEQMKSSTDAIDKAKAVKEQVDQKTEDLINQADDLEDGESE